MHAYPGRGGPDDILMAVAMFLIVQEEHSYFGTSVGGKGYTPWDDPAWTWHALYDEKPGRPLGNASYDHATCELSLCFKSPPPDCVRLLWLLYLSWGKSSTV